MQNLCRDVYPLGMPKHCIGEHGAADPGGSNSRQGHGKRGGGALHVNLEDVPELAQGSRSREIVAVDEALDALAQIDPRKRCSTNDRGGSSIHLGSKQESRKFGHIDFFTSSSPESPCPESPCPEPPRRETQCDP